MSNGINVLLAFVGGAAVGSIVTWLYFKKRYEIVVDETEAEVEVFEPKKFEPKQFTPTKEEKIEYSNVVKDLGYTNDVKEGGNELDNKPYVISPEEFHEMAEYSTASFTYYKDGVMTNEFDEIMSEEEIENTVGADATNHFGQYEDDSVFVRNDDTETDYEILLDQRNYRDAYPGPEDE